MLFPNPTSDYVIVRTEQQAIIAFMQIVDAQGRIVLRQAFDSSTKTQIISLANLSPATYTVNLLDVKGALIDKGAIIVNR